MWRPEGWQNSWDKKREENGMASKAEIFEAGASAMLEALKAKSSFMTPEQMRLIVPDRKYSFGWIIFIPNETVGDEP